MHDGDPGPSRKPVRAGIAVAVAVSVTLAATGSTVKVTPRFADRGSVEALDIAGRAGLAERSRTYTASPRDYDGDGDQDVLVSYHGEGGKLWRNRGNGTYRRVARSAWPRRNAAGKLIDRHDCAWADVDLNGRPDAYCTTGRARRNFVKVRRDNELWLQGRRSRFRDVGSRWGVGDVCGRGRFATFLDANGDRYPDLFLGNDPPRTGADRCDDPGNDLPNERSKLFINVHGGGFRNAPRFGPFAAGTGSQCALVLDYDGNGWQDLLTCRMRGQVPRLYRNQRGHGFAHVTTGHGLGKPLVDAVVADLDGDQDPDLVTAAVDGIAYHRNDDGRFSRSRPIGSPPAGTAWSVAVGDADDDGDGDVYGMAARNRTSNFDDQIWLNDAMTFTRRVQLPSAGGAADEVVALRPHRRGRAAFLALNGFAQARGPVQLIRLTGSRPRSAGAGRRARSASSSS